MANSGSPATQKQIDYILTLTGCRFLSQARGLISDRTGISLSSSQISRGLSKAQASSIIEKLLETRDTTERG